MAPRKAARTKRYQRIAPQNEFTGNCLANRFYVGSPTALRNNWGHNNLEDAVAHAEQLINQAGCGAEPKFIVQIVRIVRPQPVRTIVERF
jgi:hypothetical protein